MGCKVLFLVMLFKSREQTEFFLPNSLKTASDSAGWDDFESVELQIVRGRSEIRSCHRKKMGNLSRSSENGHTRDEKTSLFQ